MSQPIAGRITLNLIAGIVITVVTVIAGIAWMAHRQNGQAAEGTRTMVMGGIDAMNIRVQGLANDYSWWEEAYDAYVRGDAEWIDANIGTGIVDTQIADFLAIISPDGRSAIPGRRRKRPRPTTVLTEARDPAHRRHDPFGACREQRRPFRLSRHASRHAAVRRVSRRPRVEAPIRPSCAGCSAAGDGPLSRRQAAPRRSAAPSSSTTFASTSKTAPARNADSPRSPTCFGNTIGQLVWTPPAPGTAVLRNVLPPVGVVLLLFCLIAMGTAIRARRLAPLAGAEQKQAVAAARTDSLTGLTNRFGFSEIGKSPAFADACRRGEAAIVCLDVNGFKAVNDSIGHQGGDELVRRLAERLAMIMPPDANFARVGGDEFALALIGRAAPQAVAGVASAMVHALDQSFTVGGFQFQVTAAVGLMPSPRATT